LAVRASGDSGSVRDGGDSTKRLSRLSIGLGGTGSIGIDTREVLVVTIAAQESTINVGGGSIVLAANTIKNVFAVAGGVWLRRVASLKAEGSSTHEVVPLDSLNEVTSPGLGEEKGTKRVTTLIGTVGVEFPSGIIGSDVDELLLDEASDLDVVRGLHELETSDGTLGDDTGTITGLCAPGDAFAFGVADEGTRFGGAPEAEVINAVDDSGLAQRGWAFGSAVAQVVSSLGTTFTSAGICLIGQSGICEVLGGKRDVRGLRKGKRQKSGDHCDGGKDGRHFNRQK
jgi:hypothetical protein